MRQIQSIPILGEDNDDEIVGRILTRREALSVASFAGLTLLIGCGGSGGGATAATTTSTATTGGDAVDLVATPQVTEGPFFVDEKLNRSNLLGDTTRASVVNGLPLTLTFTILEIDGNSSYALSNAYVDVWHADASGAYSDENNGGIQSENTVGQTWLRGYQVTGLDGKATFQTIYPGWCQGRTIHIHFKVRRYSASGSETYEFTSQLFMDDSLNDTVMANPPYNTRCARSVYNSTDNIYSNRQADGTTVGSDLTLNMSQSGEGYVGTFAVAFNSE